MTPEMELTLRKDSFLYNERENIMSKFLVIDANSILNRAFYAIPPLTNSEGLNTNGIYGILNIL